MPQIISSDNNLRLVVWFDEFQLKHQSLYAAYDDVVTLYGDLLACVVATK